MGDNRFTGRFRRAIRGVVTDTDAVHKWDGYELVFDNEEPETDKYIRMETTNEN